MRSLPVLVVALALSGTALAQSNASAPVPVAKGEARAAFMAIPGSVPASVVALPPVDPGEIAAVRAANSRAIAKRLQVGVGRAARERRESHVRALQWREVAGGHVARWEIRSPNAAALRIGLAGALGPAVQVRFAGDAEPARVYGPFSASDMPADGATLWSPGLEGDVATVELFAPAGSALPETWIDQVSHLFVSPREDDRSLQAKVGESGSCEVNLICEAAASTALANVGRSVARMLFSEGGSSFLCTGTLIQSTDGSTTPYFYSAAHCIDTQAAASTLTTYWFYDSTSCGASSLNPGYVQLTGGATLLYQGANSSDVLLLRLNNAPPVGAWFAGWEATTLSINAPVTGIHHPAGDLKKVSHATVAAFQSPQSPYGAMIRTQWVSGVTEGGSSGSGLFTAVGSPATDYRLRGGLWGGASTCGAPQSSQYDFYSRLDLAYASIRQWIDPPPPPSYALTFKGAGTGAGTVTGLPNAINCRQPCETFTAFISVSAGTVVTLIATPAVGSVFSGWSGCTGSGGCNFTMDGARIVTATFNLQPVSATLTVTKSGTAGTVTSSQGGINCGATCAAEFAFNQVLTLNAAALAGSVFTGWSGDCAGIQPCTITMSAARNVTATFGPTSFPAVMNMSTNAINFAGQSMGTTSSSSPVVITNVGANTIVFNAISASSQFGQSGNCTNIPPGFSCMLNATFTPAVTGIALGQTAPVTGQLTIPSNATGSPHLVSLSGSAEKSLVSHYYRSILRRAPDAGGKAFWEAEAQRLVGLGINVNEAWYAMAMSFYGSAEYAAFNRGSAAFVTDLYNTFFNRTPDGGGLSFWNAEIVGGLPRGVALAAFMFSTEFRNVSQGIFGSTAVRPEIDAVVDFYRGLLGRLPDSGGFAFWLQRFRAAQCSGQAAVVSEVEAISSAFANSSEYLGRARSHPDYIGDLYNAFLRRGGDLGGVQFWINQVATAAQTREQVRVQFKNSAEFQARVNAILTAPCLP